MDTKLVTYLVIVNFKTGDISIITFPVLCATNNLLGYLYIEIL